MLQGEGGTVEPLLRQTGELTNYLADREQVFDDVVTNLTPVLDNLAGQGTERVDRRSSCSKLMTGLAKQPRRSSAEPRLHQRPARTTTALLRDARAPLGARREGAAHGADMFADQGEALRAAAWRPSAACSAPSVEPCRTGRR